MSLRPLLPLLVLAGCPKAPDLPLDIRANQNRLVVQEGSKVLSDQELVGLILEVGNSEVRIDGVRPDPKDPTGHLRLYTLTMLNPDGSTESFCNPDPEGVSMGFPIAHPDGGFSLTCTSGARAKCIRMGYPLWGKTSDGRSLAPYHAACVHMIRADYCGDDTPRTTPGTMIEIFDTTGRRPLRKSPLAFEALWGPKGAVCVRRSRKPDLHPLDRILKSCPRLESTVETCNETALGTMAGALLGNRSR